MTGWTEVKRVVEIALDVIIPRRNRYGYFVAYSYDYSSILKLKRKGKPDACPDAAT